MTVKSISTFKNITIQTEDNSVYDIEISTYLGTLVFKDTITPINKTIKIKGLNNGKYFISISNKNKLIKNTFNFKRRTVMNKIITFLLFITTTISFAKNTYVANNNFEQVLIYLGYNTALNGSITTANFNENYSLSANKNLLNNLISIYPKNPTKESFKTDTCLKINEISVFNNFRKTSIKI